MFYIHLNMYQGKYLKISTVLSRLLDKEQFTEVDIVRYPIPGILYQSTLGMEELWGGFQYSITGSCSRLTDLTDHVGKKTKITLRQAKCGGVHVCSKCPLVIPSSKHKKSCSCGGEISKMGCTVKLYGFTFKDHSYFYSEGSKTNRLCRSRTPKS